MLVKVRALEAGPDDQADIWDSAPVWVVLEEVDDDIAHGTVTDSRFDRYRNASGTDVPATGSEILPPGHGRGCSLGCIRHHAVPSRDDQSSALVQLESIRTVATRAANAVGLYGPAGSKSPILRRVPVLPRARPYRPARVASAPAGDLSGDIALR